MIQISHEFTNGYSKLIVSGHANYAERGQDVLCASVSVLLSVLINGLKAVTEEFPNHTTFIDLDLGGNVAEEKAETSYETHLRSPSDIGERIVLKRVYHDKLGNELQNPTVRIDGTFQGSAVDFAHLEQEIKKLLINTPRHKPLKEE